MFDLPSRRTLVRLLGAALLVGAALILVRGGGRLSYFSGPTVLLGVPARVGMVLHRRWGRALGIIFFAAWLVMAVLLLTRGRGATTNNLSLLFGAVAGGWAVYKWED